MAMREWLETTGGKIAVALLLLAAAGFGVWAVRNTFGTSSAVTDANTRIFIDAETGKPFRHKLKAGDPYPIPAPSGKNSGYQAELCYWTADGKTKTEPTPVLLEEAQGKPGPTFCPDCKRLVVGHNPMPKPGDKPPPTQAEYKPRGGAGGRRD